MPFQFHVFRRIGCSLGLSSVLFAQSLQITSPTDGTVVAPGQSLSVSVTATGGTFQQVVVMGDGPIKMTAPLAAPPYNFTVQIPSAITPGKYSLTASGFTAPGEGAESESIDIVVEPAENPIALSIQPTTVSMRVGDVAPLRVVGKFASGAERLMTFSGRISYATTSPAIATVDNVGRITAVSPGNTLVLVSGGGPGLRIPVSVAAYMKVVPPAAILYAGEPLELGAQVNLAADQTATWSITPNVGTMSGIGPNIATYTAPASITTQQQVTITATSVADPTKSATATVTLYPPVSISVSPTNAMLRASQTQQFVATVANAMDTGVTWSVVPAGVGTITATGLYTAPRQFRQTK
jgi:hypothetical protein